MTTYKREFEDKLNELGIKEIFTDNLTDESDEYIEALNEEKHWDGFVSCAFAWDQTKQGADFWLEVAYK